MATNTDNISPVNKPTPTHIADEIDLIKIGFGILEEYIFEGGPERQQQWLCDVISKMLEEVEQSARAVANAVDGGAA
jgi:hypothetical protein